MAVHCSVLRKRDLMRKLRRRAFKKRITRWFPFLVSADDSLAPDGCHSGGGEGRTVRINAPHTGGVQGFHLPAVRLY